MGWWIKVNIEGQPGHGSMFLENTAGKKLQYIINKFMDYRDVNEKKFKANPSAGLGSVTTVNLTLVDGGVQPNVVPAHLSATFDVRIPPTEDFDALLATMKKWCKEAGPNVELEFIQFGKNPETVDISPKNPWWAAFCDACKASDIDIQTEIFPAFTDSRHYRKAGISMLGFSPMNNTEILLHDHDERLREDVFLRGIDIYCKIIPALANQLV